uniref:Si946063f09 n=1 Tax=Arundo donax TaxID=35708 RepID=A0A0A9FS80_ARUDO
MIPCCHFILIVVKRKFVYLSSHAVLDQFYARKVKQLNCS